MTCDGAEDVIIAVNSTKSLSTASNPTNSLAFLGGILCAKASMLLQVSFKSSLQVQNNLLILIFYFFSSAFLFSTSGTFQHDGNVILPENFNVGGVPLT